MVASLLVRILSWHLAFSSGLPTVKTIGLKFILDGHRILAYSLPSFTWQQLKWCIIYTKKWKKEIHNYFSLKTKVLLKLWVVVGWGSRIHNACIVRLVIPGLFSTSDLSIIYEDSLRLIWKNKNKTKKKQQPNVLELLVLSMDYRKANLSTLGRFSWDKLLCETTDKALNSHCFLVFCFFPPPQIGFKIPMKWNH